MHLNGIKPPFLGHRFALALVGIRRLVVQIKGISKNGLVLPSQAGEKAAQSMAQLEVAAKRDQTAC